MEAFAFKHVTGGDGPYVYLVASFSGGEFRCIDGSVRTATESDAILGVEFGETSRDLS